MARIALVGCGLWGKNILRALLALRAEVSVVDPIGARRDEALAQGALGAFPSLDRIRNAGGFIIATPATTHAAVLSDTLSFGKPIFVEKPLTTDLVSAGRLAGIGGFFVMDIWRYHPGIRALAGIAASQELGPVQVLRSTRTNWTSPRRDTDPLWTLLPHDLSITLEILGAIPAARYAVAEYREGSPAGAIVTLGHAPVVVIEASTRYPDKRREVRLHCRDGVAVLNATGQPVIEIFREQNGGGPASTVRPFLTDEPLQIELKAFLDYLDGGPPPKSSASEGLAIVETITTIRQLAGIDPG